MSIDPTARFAHQQAQQAARVAELERLSSSRASAADGSYIPALSGTAVGTVGASNIADWSVAGNLLTVTGKFVYGTTAPTYPSTVTLVALPAGFDVATTEAGTPVGMCEMNIDGINYPGRVWAHQPTRVRLVTAEVVSSRPRTVAPSSTIPAVWEPGSFVRYQYQVRIRRALI